MKAHIKSGVEYAVIALLVAGLCLWQIISGAQDDEPPASRMALLGLGLAVAATMHCVFMMQLVRHTGRPVLRWFFAIVLLPPIGTAVLLALLLGEAEPSEN
jgi:multisubunit Na+/H+ antiporter MnhE subunit